MAANMSACLLALHRCCQYPALALVARRQWSSSPAPPPLHRRLLLFLTQQYSDIEMLISWSSRRTRKQLHKKNVYYGYTESFYGRDVASAYFVLRMKGTFRYVGQSEWYGADQRNKLGLFEDWEFLNYKERQLEEVDLSDTEINYTGLSNIEVQRSLKTLKVSHCPEVDDWFLEKLHIFEDTLEELDISHCPRITIGGLAALRNLKGLKRLNVSSLAKISNPGLVIILLEEMLPQCDITATGYKLDLDPVMDNEEEEEEEEMEKEKNLFQRWR
ncbi:distal membrane-arm assembly complex protein 2 [Gouania willdenowi]|uniref:Distal membrane-arm assembly complex protein 2 n=1 Tax=Gouania willdenowi TaxID=441366 RepID=A0A8C5G468_GOUWI|nr:distal membrane-arm assembly complex protein 2 [Gouania willdenowi]